MIKCNHKWVMTPYTRYEMKHVLNVREARQTVVIKYNKIFNIDTGKFDFDSLPTLNTELMGDLFEAGPYYEHHSYLESNREEMLRPLASDALVSDAIELPKTIRPPRRIDTLEEQEAEEEKERLALNARLQEELKARIAALDAELEANNTKIAFTKIIRNTWIPK